MIRRWLIRALALTLLTLCVGAWVGSYWKPFMVGRTGPRQVWLHLRYGSIQFDDYLEPLSGITEWELNRVGVRRQYDRQTYIQMRYHFAGFAYDGTTLLPEYAGFQAWVPLWFPTLLSALLLWLVWRKTRPTYNGRGFPVEVAGKEATKP